MSATCPPIQITFAPAWWRACYGMTFTESLLRDPIARTELDREQRRLLYERFGDVGLGERDPQPHPAADGAYGHRFMAALWGCEICYLPDQAPAAIALPDAADRLAALQLSDFERSPVARQCLAEAETLGQRYGVCDGAINQGGPLNNAVSVLGEAILAACVSEPGVARQALMRMAEACLWVYDNLTRRIDGIAASAKRANLGLGNCPVCMVSPATYQAVVLPADLWYREHYEALLLHHCGVFHPYREVYKPLRPEHLDVGWGTDLRLVRQTYPTTPLSIEIQAKALIGKSRDELDRMVRRLLADASPIEQITHLWVAEAGPDVPDETVRNLVTAPGRLKQETT